MKERMERELPDSLLNIISLTDNQGSISWEEEGHEFSFRDQLYDVVRTTHRGGKVYLSCLADEKEEALVRKVCAITGNDQHPDRKSNTPPVFKIADDFVLDTASVPSRGHRAARVFSYMYTVQLPQRERMINVPPPRC